MLLHVFKFKLVSGGCKREQVCEIWVKCKIYPPSHSLWNSNETGRVFCEVLGKQEKGVWRREQIPGSWGLGTSLQLCCTEGTTAESWWRERSSDGARRTVCEECEEPIVAGTREELWWWATDGDAEGQQRNLQRSSSADRRETWLHAVRVGGSKGRDCKARMDVDSESGKCL